MRVCSQPRFWAATFALAALAGASAQEPELSARDIFRKAAGALGPARSEDEKPPEKKPTSSASNKLTKVADSKQQPDAKPEQRRQEANQSETEKADVKIPAQPPDRPDTSLSGQAQVILTSLESEVPLALRYSLEKDMGGGRGNEVPADTVFRSGDRIRINVQSNQQAYLYLVLKGSSGRWRVLFPSKEIHDGANLVGAYQSYLAPPPEVGWFAFDEQVGEEQLFVMLSRKRVRDIDSLIYEMATPPGAAPSPSKKPEAEFILAKNMPTIDDALVGRLRSEVYARDLVFERIDEKSEQGEAAVYVAAKDASEDSRVVVDVTLKHR